MKTYEEMARDVLRRRDEELQSIQTADTTASNDVTLDVATPAAGRKHGLKRMIIPGAAAVTAAAVGLTIWHNTGLFNRSSCESGDYRFSDFQGNPIQTPVVGEVSEYPGGETEININPHKNEDDPDYYRMTSPYYDRETLDQADLTVLSEDEINGFYGIELDRLTDYLHDWEVSSEIFGYYSRDEETLDIVRHQPHGYYSKNRISYSGEAGDFIEIIAEFSDTPWSKMFSKTDQKSIINGFDAMIYGDDGGKFFDSTAYLSMNGVTVYIRAWCIYEERFIELLDIFTSPSPDSKNYPVDRVSILDRRPAELLNNDPFAAEPPSGVEGVWFTRWTLDDMNRHYGFDTNKLGKLYSTWKVSGTKNLGEYSNTNGACNDPPIKISYNLNTLYYTTGNGVDVELSISSGAILPSCEGSSYINGYYAVIFRDPDSLLASESIREHDNDTRERFSAYIKFGYKAVKIFAAGLSDDEFLDVIKAFTTPLEQPEESEEKEEEPSGNVYNIHNYMPEYLIENKHGFFNGRCITEDVSLVSYTKDELSVLYGIEFDRFGRLHDDWEEYISRELGVIVSDYESTESTDGMTIGGRRVVTTLNELHYNLTDGEDIIDLCVSAVIIGEPEDMFSPFSGFYPEPGLFSLINDKIALIWRDGDRVSGDHSAIIKMGETLVMISMNDVSERDFLNALDEYTADDDRSDKYENVSAKDSVNILDQIPGDLLQSGVFNGTGGNQFNDCTFVPYTKEELNSFYGIEFDCLGKFHDDWEEIIENDLGVLVRDVEGYETENGTVADRRDNAWTHNCLEYRISDKASISVEARIDDMIPPFDYFASNNPDCISVVNGRKAVIYRDKENSSKLSAVMGMGKTVVDIYADGLSEEEFINVLREFAAGKSTADVTDRIPFKVYNAVDPIDDRITYTVKLSENKILYHKVSALESGTQTEDSTAALGYLKEFFRTDDLPVDKAYRDNMLRYVCDANFVCKVSPGTIARSPVEGKVIAANTYNSTLGKVVAVEFGDNIFILTNLDKVSVKTGDRITAGQELGVCGTTENDAYLSMILLKITDLRS